MSWVVGPTLKSKQKLILLQLSNYEFGPRLLPARKKHLFWIFPTFLKLFDGEDCDSLWRERGGLTNQVDKGDKVAKEGAGKSESPDHKPVMKASNNLQCQCCCRHLMLYPETEIEFSVKWTTSCSSSCQSRWASQSRSLRLVAARERTMLNSRNSFHSEIFGKGDIWRRRHFQEVLTCPLGFWRGVKLSPQKTRREERRVRKTKQGKRPWVESRKGLTKLDFEQSWFL